MVWLGTRTLPCSLPSGTRAARRRITSQGGGHLPWPLPIALIESIVRRRLGLWVELARRSAPGFPSVAGPGPALGAETMMRTSPP